MIILILSINGRFSKVTKYFIVLALQNKIELKLQKLQSKQKNSNVCFRQCTYRIITWIFKKEIKVERTITCGHKPVSHSATLCKAESYIPLIQDEVLFSRPDP